MNLWKLVTTLFLSFILFSFQPASAIMPPTKTTILVFGDSLSAAYGIPVEKGWVNLLQEKLGENFHVANASISGETTSGGLNRLLPSLSAIKPHYVIIELGANDGLQGKSVKEIQANLEQMIKLATAESVKVILLGIRLPPNYGASYTEQFDKIYKDLAEQYKLPFVPFLLEGVATDFNLMQADGLHPTAEAQPKILEHLWPILEPVLVDVLKK
ncbi:arylesterase [uncultured Thiothrix sp.]|uniref:arylesterase n=1 Tax=uncultured Thiothrix sp. TaxID=223185 RepID=UPI00262CCF68|nr:arylesterase [uncultured Thiothrix sp.]